MTLTAKDIRLWLPSLSAFEAWGVLENFLIVALETRPNRDIDSFSSDGKRWKFLGYAEAFTNLCDQLVSEGLSRGLDLMSLSYQALDLRDLAIRAGIGFRGKNSLVYHPRYGCTLRFAVLEICNIPVVSITWPPVSHCGSCVACLQICPSKALAPFEMVKKHRCRAYIELDNPAAVAQRCSLCASVCPSEGY